MTMLAPMNVPMQRHAAPLPAGGAAERRLLDQVGRAPRQGWAAMILHLSRLPPPAPRPHHRRVVRAILQDAAQRFEGQFFALRNGDMVLLCRANALTTPSGRSAASLPDVLAKLLQVNTLPTEILSVWPLTERSQQLLTYAGERLADAVMDPPCELDTVVPTVSMDAFARLFETEGPDRMVQGALLHRQTAVQLASDGALGRVLRPIYREVSFSLAELEAQAKCGVATADPFLFRHLAGRLDLRMLAGLTGELGRGGVLDADATPRLHINLTPASVLSVDFNGFAAACEVANATIGIECDLIEAVADPELFHAARARLARAGMSLVLDGVTHQAMLLSRPDTLLPDLLKLNWEPRIAGLAQDERARLEDLLGAVGIARVVLQHADSEAALHWGLGLGISRFQGRHVDVMLGAQRILACPDRRDCTLRQCVAREAAIGLAGRYGCSNLALLDAGAPAA